MKRLDRISNGDLSVAATSTGAELCSLRTADGAELLWQADPAVWGRHAPNLFPIVGKLAGDRYTHRGRTYQMAQHGFARDHAFALIEADASSLTYQLRADDTTRAIYPFAFELTVRYALSGSSLAVTYTVSNLGDEVMPFSVGAHPGFALNWGGPHDPLTDYFIAFATPEPEPAHLLEASHLLGSTTTAALDGGVRLNLRADRFHRDALLFLHPRSDAVTLGSTRHPRRIQVAFAGFPHLGIWSKPGAPFVCIEPWRGHADPATGGGGELLRKPGIERLHPHSRESATYQIRVA